MRILWVSLSLAGALMCQTPEQELRLLEEAARAAPLEPVPHLALATAYLERYKPDNSPEHEQFADKAERELRTVLQMQPDNLQAMQHLANLFFTRSAAKGDVADKRPLLDESVYWNERILSRQPDNTIAHYSLGVIAWTRFFPEWAKARAKLQMKPDQPGPLASAADRAELRAQYGSMLDAGIRSLERAIEIDPKYDDALAYLNLLYRERADLQDSQEAYKRDVEIADKLVQRALELKRARAPGTISPMPVSGPTRPAKLIHQATPVYPEQAIKIGLQGSVRYKGRVMKDGTLANLALLNGHPLLVPTATAALRDYRYQPATLNGMLVEEDIEVQVDFVLP
jgi:tetratricopeptide (TPR) repeat protein